MLRSMWVAAPPLEVNEEQLRTLQAWVAARITPQRVALRSRIVLLAHEGLANHAIAQRLDISRPTVILWRERFAQEGVEALTEDAPGRGRKREITPAQVAAVVNATLRLRIL